MPTSKANPSNIYSLCRGINSLWAKIPQGHVKFKVGDLVSVTKEKVKFAKGMIKPFQQRYFGLSRLFSAFPDLFTNCQTCRMVLSKASFTITCLSWSLYHPRPSLK